MDPRFPALAPPDPAPAVRRTRIVTRALPRPSALPLAEWGVFGVLLAALLLMR
jgi:hypothetical protein